MNPVRAGLVVLLVSAAAGCGGNGDGATPASTVVGSRDGLELRATVHVEDDAVVVDASVRNSRDEPAHLATDLCGRITVAAIVPGRLTPEGAIWDGALQAAKRHVLRQQLAGQIRSFEPRSRGAGASDDRPHCDVAKHAAVLAPGQQVRERWVRSTKTGDGSAVEPTGFLHVALVENGVVDGLDAVDVFATGGTAGRFSGRRLQVEQPLGGADAPAGRTQTLGQLYDRLMLDPRLRAWAASQPEDWRFAAFAVGGGALSGKTKLRLLSSRYVRAAVVIADEDGSHPSVELPTEADMWRPFRHRPATLPAGVAEIYEPHGFDRLEDILTGTVVIPSGRLAISDLFFGYWTPPFRLHPGAYPTFVTMAVPHGYDRKAPPPFDDRNVALATLVLSDRPTVRWEAHGAMTTDAGLGGFSSVEGAARISRENRVDDEWYLDRIEEAEASSAVSVGNVRVGEGLNVVTFAPGLGDNTYPLYIGYDVGGRPTRIVLDGLLLHLTWPR